MNNQPRRYPGAKPFTEDQSNIFYGRDGASKSLHRLIKQEDLVVLHAKSGIGKSSLIKAGLLPLVRKEGLLEPLEIRLGAAGSAGQQAPVVRTAEVIEQATTDLTASAFIDQLLPDDNSLWRKLKHFQLSQLANLKEGEPASEILLIFDQFEELFTYSGPEKLKFRRELAEVLHTPLPQRYWDMLSLYDGFESPITPEQRQLLLKPLNLHVLTAIREDRIHLLGGMADYLPMISKNWFVLEHLNEAEATEAIEAPAALTGDFATAPFTFAPATRDAIIEYLATDKVGGIESTQLQVICDAIDRRTATDTDRLITPKRVGDLRQITEQYYWDKLADIEDEEQRKLARLLIEDQLIYEQAERRLSLFSGQIIDHGLQPETLQLLVNGYLLRAEPDLRGGYNYELSHDSLVAPILKAKRERVAEEEKLQALTLAKEQEAVLAAEREKGRKARRLNSILFGLLTLAIVAIGISVYFYFDALEKSEEAAESLAKYETEAREKLIIQERENLQKAQQYLDDIDIFLISGDIESAKARLREVEELEIAELQSSIAELWKRAKELE